jgi:hypothetical protein
LTISADIAGRPSARWVFSHPAHIIAFGFGIVLEQGDARSGPAPA